MTYTPNRAQEKSTEAQILVIFAKSAWIMKSTSSWRRQVVTPINTRRKFFWLVFEGSLDVTFRDYITYTVIQIIFAQGDISRIYMNSAEGVILVIYMNSAEGDILLIQVKSAEGDISVKQGEGQVLRSGSTFGQSLSRIWSLEQGTGRMDSGIAQQGSAMESEGSDTMERVLAKSDLLRVLRVRMIQIRKNRKHNIRDLVRFGFVGSDRVLTYLAVVTRMLIYLLKCLCIRLR